MLGSESGHERKAEEADAAAEDERTSSSGPRVDPDALTNEPRSLDSLFRELARAEARAVGSVPASPLLSRTWTEEAAEEGEDNGHKAEEGWDGVPRGDEPPVRDMMGTWVSGLPVGLGRDVGIRGGDFEDVRGDIEGGDEQWRRSSRRVGPWDPEARGGVGRWLGYGGGLMKPPKAPRHVSPQSGRMEVPSSLEASVRRFLRGKAMVHVAQRAARLATRIEDARTQACKDILRRIPGAETGKRPGKRGDFKGTSKAKAGEQDKWAKAHERLEVDAAGGVGSPPEVLDGVTEQSVVAPKEALLYGDMKDVRAYVAVWMPSYYAAVTRALMETRWRLGEGWKPRRMLDFGAGPGTSIWAARSAFRNEEDATMDGWQQDVTLDGGETEGGSEREGKWVKGSLGRAFYPKSVGVEEAAEEGGGMSIEYVAAVEPSEAMFRAGAELLRQPPDDKGEGGDVWSRGNVGGVAVDWYERLDPPRSDARRAALAKPKGKEDERGLRSGKFDLVTAAFSLGELLPGQRKAVTSMLWDHVSPGGVLVVVESGDKLGAEVVHGVREAILKRNVPKEGASPGRQEAKRMWKGTTVAPCGHDKACPLRVGSEITRHLPQAEDRRRAADTQAYIVAAGGRVLGTKVKRGADAGASDHVWKKGDKKAPYCHFSQVLYRTPQMKQAKRRVGSHGFKKGDKPGERQTVSFSYVAMRKVPMGAEAAEEMRDLGQNWDNFQRMARIVNNPRKSAGHVLIDVCSPEGRFERRTYTKKHVVDGVRVFRAARKTLWGGAWPFAATSNYAKYRYDPSVALPDGFGTDKGLNLPPPNAAKLLED